MTIQEKIRALTENEEFVEAYKKVTNAQEVVDLYRQYDVEVPLEIAQELFEREDEELSEEALDEVAGGGKWGFVVGELYYGAGYLGGRLAGWDKKRSKDYAKKCKTVGKVLGTAIDWAL